MLFCDLGRIAFSPILFYNLCMATSVWNAHGMCYFIFYEWALPYFANGLDFFVCCRLQWRSLQKHNNISLLSWLDRKFVIPQSGFKLNEKCVITIGQGAVSAIYNGITNKFNLCVSMLLPVVVLTGILCIFLLLSATQIKNIILFLLILNVYGGYTDIYMFFYIIKRIHKNDKTFGLYRLDGSNM